MAKRKKSSPGNGAGSRVVYDKSDDSSDEWFNIDAHAAEESRPGRKVKKPVKDINLPDEKAGKVIADIDVSGPPGNRKTRPVYGGDKEDFRWDEHERRKADLKKKGGTGIGSRVVR